jgi:hypothetical protein
MGAPQISWGISEGEVDLPFSTSTYGFVGVGQSVTGTIGYFFDRDVFRTELVAGETVSIQARGGHSGGGTLHDPDVTIYGSDGRYLATDGDSGVGLDANLIYTPSTSGTYYIMVDGFLHEGTYTVDVTRAASSATLASAADEPVVDHPAPAPPRFDDIQLKTLGPEPVYTDWVY